MAEILLLEDKLGITSGYSYIWDQLVLNANLGGHHIRRASIWKSPIAKSTKLLTSKGNRKSPGYNPDPGVLAVEATWLRKRIVEAKAEAILCMDLAMLGMVEPDWDNATIDNLRGGLYHFDSIPFLITVPISAVHTKKKQKDIRAMNAGAENEEEWEDEEHDEKDLFIEPYTIPYGKWILQADLKKLTRVISATSRRAAS